MRQHKAIGIAGLLVIGGLLGIVAIMSDDASAGTFISGHIIADTIWTIENSPYCIKGDVIVDEGATLTIDPGVEVRFNGYYSLYVEGNIKAVGTPHKRIIISSNKTSPEAGDWNRIQLNSTGKGRFDYCNISCGAFNVYLLESSNNTILNSIVHSFTECGIFVESSSNNSIYNNTIDCSGGFSTVGPTGISLLSSTNNSVYNNTIDFWGGGIGISLESSSNNIFHDNNITNTPALDFWDKYQGLCLSVNGKEKPHFNNTISTSNTVNGKQVYYLYDIRDTVLEGLEAGQIMIAWSENVTVRQSEIRSGDYLKLNHVNNSTIANCITEFSYEGISLYHSMNNMIIENTFNRNFWIEVELYQSPNNTLIKNDILDISDRRDGVIVWESNKNVISENLISGFDYGIYLRSSRNNEVVKNTIIKNRCGIVASNSSYNNILKCNISQNTENGVYLSSCSVNTITNCTLSYNQNGVFLHTSQANIISNCNVSNSDVGINIGFSSDNFINNCNLFYNLHGISFLESANTTVVNCNILLNSYHGVLLTDSSDHNNLSHNNFIANTHHAEDRCINDWDDGSIGNYWDDYIGVDANDDGIGDTPYYLPGGINQDRYPLVSPWGFPPPLVIFVTPENDTMNISISPQIIVKFDKEMNKTSSQQAFTLETGGICVPGNFTWNDANNTMIFFPSIDLLGETKYCVNITILATDLEGNSLLAPWTSSFVTKETTPPIVLSVMPTNGQVNISIDTSLRITFSEKMNKTSVENAIMISGGLSAVSFDWVDDGRTVSFVPSSDLEYNTEYMIAINGSVAIDLAGNLLDGNKDGAGGDNYSWTFSTETKPVLPFDFLKYGGIAILLTIVIVVVFVLILLRGGKKETAIESDKSGNQKYDP